MKALLFATNTQPQTLADGGTLSFGMPVRRYGKNIQSSGGNVVINGEGYYPMIAGVAFEPAATGTFTVQLFENGVAIPGARALVTAATDVLVTVPIPATVRIRCCEEKVITASISGGAVTVDNANILAVKA